MKQVVCELLVTLPVWIFLGVGGMGVSEVLEDF